MGRLASVNVLHRLREGRWAMTAIDKRPVSGPVVVGEHGLAGDRQMQKVHGGPDKAVYAYAEEDARWWAGRLGRPVPAGLFGENLTTVGVAVTAAEIGERWRVGGVELEVRMPRTPCENLSRRVGVEGFHVDFVRSGRVGALLAVRRPGELAAGDEVVVLDRPGHGVSVGDWARGATPDQAAALLGAGIALARPVRARARRLTAG